MSYNRAYTEGEMVKIDQGVLVGTPTLGPCTVSAEVLAASVAAEVQVYVHPVGYSPLYVFKDRVEP